MSPVRHVISGAALGTAVYGLTKKPGMALMAGIASFGCDLDHILEYGLYCVSRNKKPDPKEFFSGKYYRRKGTILIIFHGYEYLLLLCVTAYLKKSDILKGVALGYGTHLLLDTIGNDAGLKGYFISYRARVGWDIDKICGPQRER